MLNTSAYLALFSHCGDIVLIKSLPILTEVLVVSQVLAMSLWQRYRVGYKSSESQIYEWP